MQKQVNPGVDDFRELVETNSYYVDKTRFLRPVFANPARVMLFTRPRRFGKTLTLSMFREFLNIDCQNPGSTKSQQRLFNSLEVMQDHDMCERFMGRHPVILISLKSVQGPDFGAAMRTIAGLEASIASKFDFLKDSPHLDDVDKETFEILRRSGELQKEANSDYLEGFLVKLSTLLFKHFSRRVVVLIDEYDVPLAKAQQKGFHGMMADFYTKFLDLLKTDGAGSPIQKIIMTGCLRVAKNQIFTGANNFAPYTILSKDTDFSSIFGFTPAETEAYLAAFGLSGYRDMVKEHYDGYRFGYDEIYNPWDVCRFVQEAWKAIDQGRERDVKPENYWSGSESTNTTAIKDYVGTLSRDDNQRLQDLLDGKEVEVEINDDMNYDCLDERKARDMWSLLLHTGYLTATKVVTSKKCVVKIPNKEIKECFNDSIMASFEETVSKGRTNLALLDALSSGEDAKAQTLLQGMLSSFVSIRAFATRREPENYYEGFLTGLLASLGRHLQDLKVESDAGNGYADIQFRYRNGTCAMVIELKAARSVGELSSDVQRALAQIEEKQYASRYVEDPTIFKVTAAGIAFLGKSCLVATKALKDQLP